MTTNMRLKEQKELVTQRSFSNFIYEEFNLFTLSEAKRITKVFFATVKEILKNEKNVYLKDFGMLEIVKIPPIFRSNVKLGKKVWFTSHRTVRFRPTAEMSKAVVRQRGYVPMPTLNIENVYKPKTRKKEQE